MVLNVFSVYHILNDTPPMTENEILKNMDELNNLSNFVNFMINGLYYMKTVKKGKQFKPVLVPYEKVNIRKIQFNDKHEYFINIGAHVLPCH